MSTLSNSVLNIIQTFSPEDMAAFSLEFNKLQKPVAKCKPKKIKATPFIPSPEERERMVLAKWHPSARKLA